MGSNLAAKPGGEAADPVDEVTFQLTDPAYPFVGLSAISDGQVDLVRMIPRPGGKYGEFFSITGIAPNIVIDTAEEHDHVEASVVTRREDGGLFEFVVDGGCPARCLAKLGAIPLDVYALRGTGRIMAKITPGYDTAEVVGAFLDEHPSAELVAKREQDHPGPLLTERELTQAVDARLTDRQQEVLRAAFDAGYYDCPRATPGADIAAELGVSSATFSEHIRAAESNLLALLYEEHAL